MSLLDTIVRKLSEYMNTLAGIVLFFMMMLTVADVVLRLFGAAIIGTYELVAISGAIVVGFAVPQTSRENGHVCVDFLIENRSQVVRNTVFFITRVLGICLFAILSYYLLLKAVHLYKTDEVSLTLHIPYYPAAFGLSFCFLIECLTLIANLFKTLTVEDKNG